MISFGERTGQRTLRALGLFIGLMIALTGCTAKGGGWLPPGENGLEPNGEARFGFEFRCESGQEFVGEDTVTEPRGQVQYHDTSTNGLYSSGVAIHGEVLTVVVPAFGEQARCIGNIGDSTQPITFKGIYRPQSSDPLA